MRLMFYVNITMNMKDKTDRLLEAIEHPERFSEEEINEMLEDGEIQELYNLMSKTSDALTKTSEPDIDKEWQRFVKKHDNTSQPKGRIIDSMRLFFYRNAAAILICTVASLAVVAATVGVAYSLDRPKKEELTQKDDEPVSYRAEESDSVSISVISPVEPQTVIFKDETFSAMMDAIAGYYGASVNFKNDSSKELHLYFQWDQSLPLDEIIEQLNNFEQIRIDFTDNTLNIE